jgi:hypothetical protein
MGKHVRQSAIRHRALIEVAAGQRHPLRLQPAVHFFARELSYRRLATHDSPGAVHGGMQQRA